MSGRPPPQPDRTKQESRQDQARHGLGEYTSMFRRSHLLVGGPGRPRNGPAPRRIESADASPPNERCSVRRRASAAGDDESAGPSSVKADEPWRWNRRAACRSRSGSTRWMWICWAGERSSKRRPKGLWPVPGGCPPRLDARRQPGRAQLRIVAQKRMLRLLDGITQPAAGIGAQTAATRAIG
jgi:hypothetical protein